MARVPGCRDGEGSPLVNLAWPDKGATCGKAKVDVELQELADAKAWSAGNVSSSWQVMQRVWFLSLLAAMFQVFMCLEVYIYMPYLYTRVHCCAKGQELDSRYDVTDPLELASILAEASAAGLEVELSREPGGSDMLKACSVPYLPPRSRLWSFSPLCANRAYVEDTAQDIMAKMKPLQKALSLVVLPVGGACSDAIGRRPVLVAYAVFLLLACAISALDTTFHVVWGDGAAYLGCVLLCISFQPKDTILASGVADVIGRDEVGKSRTFACLMGVTTVTSLACTIMAYGIVRIHLTTYLMPWLGLVGLSIIMLVVLFATPETLPDGLRRPLTPAMFNPLRTQISGMQLLARDPVLVHLGITAFLFWACFIGFMTIKVSYFVTVGFTIEETMLPGICALVIQAIVSAMLPTWLPRLGTWSSAILSYTFYCISFFFLGPAAVLYGRFWVYIGEAVGSVAIAFLLPTMQTIVSERVEEDSQGKCQSALSAMGAVSAIVGVPIYNHVLFSATARGLHRAWPALASLGLALACLGLSLRIAALAKTTPAAIDRERPTPGVA